MESRCTSWPSVHCRFDKHRGSERRGLLCPSILLSHAARLGATNSSVLALCVSLWLLTGRPVFANPVLLERFSTNRSGYRMATLSLEHSQLAELKQSGSDPDALHSKHSRGKSQTPDTIHTSHSGPKYSLAATDILTVYDTVESLNVNRLQNLNSVSVSRLRRETLADDERVETQQTFSSVMSKANGQQLGENVISKRSLNTQEPSIPQLSTELALRNRTAAELDYIDQINKYDQCVGRLGFNANSSRQKSSLLKRFASQIHSTRHVANTLTELYNQCSELEDAPYIKSIVESLVKSDSAIYGCAIVPAPGSTLPPTGSGLYYYGLSPIPLDPEDYARADWVMDIDENAATSADSPLSADMGGWHGPEFSCLAGHKHGWVQTYSVPVYGCNGTLKRILAVQLDLNNVPIDQCSVDPEVPYHNTHDCHPSTKCVNSRLSGPAFAAHNYQCVCREGTYSPQTSGVNVTQSDFPGHRVAAAYTQWLLGQSSDYPQHFSCLPCARGCDTCHNATVCYVQYDVILRGIPLGVTCFTMIVSLILAYSIIRLRKSRVMKASFWMLLEICIFGALLLYSTIVLQYFEPTSLFCLLIPCLREVGFSILYGALVLKLYRVLAEFQSRKAHRVHVRNKDLLKWLLIIVFVVIFYMAAWTTLNVEHLDDLVDTLVYRGLKYSVCRERWWDYLIELQEFLFLCFGIYLCYCIRCAPSDYYETRYISWAIYIETLISAILHISRHIFWSITHPDYLYMMYFIRCQLTITVNLALVFGPKVYYAYYPPDDDAFRRRTYSSSEAHDNVSPEAVKLHVGVNSNGDVDVGEVNLSDMDPEDIRAELRRLYTQLQIYKTKTMRKENPHIPKRRGGRKHTNRKFSLTAFHYKHRQHHAPHPHTPAAMSDVSCDHDTELSRTPEESTNSADYGYSVDESSRGGTGMANESSSSPAVTFAPCHKTITIFK